MLLGQKVIETKDDSQPLSKAHKIFPGYWVERWKNCLVLVH